jgi:hypothetical protein
MNCNGNKNVYLTDITQTTNFLAYVTIKHSSDFKTFLSLTTCTCHCLTANNDKKKLYKVQNLSPRGFLMNSDPHYGGESMLQ